MSHRPQTTQTLARAHLTCSIFVVFFVYIGMDLGSKFVSFKRRWHIFRCCTKNSNNTMASPVARNLLKLIGITNMFWFHHLPARSLWIPHARSENFIYALRGKSIPWLQDPWSNDSDATKGWLRIRDSAYMTKWWLCDSWLRLHDFDFVCLALR